MRAIILSLRILRWDYMINTKPGFEDLKTVVDSTKYLFICVPTPVNNKGQQDVNCVFDTVEDINKTAKDSKIIILRSTVLPGTTKILQTK